MTRLCLVVFVLIASSSDRMFAGTIQVPKDRQTIQAAIDAAAPGDTVLVAAGTYRERIRLQDGVTLRSAGDEAQGTLGLKRAEATILDGGGRIGEGPGVAMAEGSTLDGLTVTNVGVYDDAEWTRHHTTQGNQQPHEHIGQPGTAGIGAIGVTCTIKTVTPASRSKGLKASAARRRSCGISVTATWGAASAQCGVPPPLSKRIRAFRISMPALDTKARALR
jgi:hypothetical protein